MGNIIILESDETLMVKFRISPGTVQLLDELVNRMCDFAIAEHCEVRIAKYDNYEAILFCNCPTMESANFMRNYDWIEFGGENT